MKNMQNIWSAEIKRTRQRESVFSILENSEKPLSAAYICSEMQKRGEAAWMSTVYRVLELFVKHNMVIKTSVMNTEMAMYELNRFVHKHYAVCINCHKMISMYNCPMDKFVPDLKDKDFDVMGHNLEIFGYCKDCKTV